MKQFYTSLSAIIMMLAASPMLYAQCTNGRYHDIVFPGAPTVTSDVTYGSNTTSINTQQSLKFDVYQPAGDISTTRAVVIIIHGGSFTSGSKTDAGYVALANAFAQMGFVAVSMDYRLGFPQDQYGLNSAIMRGVHDSRAAVRYLRDNAINGANTYGIDPTQIYLYGVSAGAIISLHHAYQNLQSEQTMSCNNQPGSECPSIEGTSNTLGISSLVQGIVSISGGIRDLNWITTNDVPAFLAHGTVDGTVPYGAGTFGGFFAINGSSVIDTRMNTTSTVHCFKPLYGQDHVITNSAYIDTVAGITRNFLESMVCTVTLNCTYTGLPGIVTALNEIMKAENTVNVFPNPSGGDITINLAAFAGNRVSIELMDATGRKVKAIKNIDAGSYNLVRDNLPAGIYSLSVYAGGDVYRKKVVLQ